MTINRPCGRKSSILDRLPERLVVHGYRNWLAGVESRSMEPWDRARALYFEELGPWHAHDALARLRAWVGACSGFCDRRLEFCPFPCRHLCRDECLALTLISALQHDDDASVDLCLTMMGAEAGRLKVAGAAAAFAAGLYGMGHRLLAVPYAVTEDIATRPPRERFH